MFPPSSPPRPATLSWLASPSVPPSRGWTWSAFIIAQVVSVPKNGGVYYLMTAIFTTLLSIVVFLIMNRTLGTKQPSQPIFAVTR